MRVLFAGTPDFSVPALIALASQHEIVGVFTQPDRKSGRGKKVTMPPIKKTALEHGLTVFQPESLHDQVEAIAALQPDTFVVVAYGMLLPQSILDIPKLGCINIHASILPRWRGAAPIQRAIEAGDKETGVSIMQMEAGLDTGPVFQILKTDISTTDTSQSLHDRLAKLGAKGVSETLTQLESALINQDEAIKAKQQNNNLANYAKKINKAEAQIDWQQSADQLQCRIRAFNPWPICQTYHQQTRVRIWQSSTLNEAMSISAAKPGEVIDIVKDGILVACGADTETNKTTVLKLQTLQRDGGKPLDSNTFLNGYNINIGDFFTTI